MKTVLYTQVYLPCVLSNYICREQYCVAVFGYLNGPGTSSASSAIILLPKRREANSWNSYLVVSICFLGYKLRGMFMSQGCILLCVVQTWKKKKTVLTSDLMQLSHRIKVSNREGCKEARDNTDKRWFWHCFAPCVCFPIGG